MDEKEEFERNVRRIVASAAPKTHPWADRLLGALFSAAILITVHFVLFPC